MWTLLVPTWAACLLFLASSERVRPYCCLVIAPSPASGQFWRDYRFNFINVLTSVRYLRLLYRNATSAGDDPTSIRQLFDLTAILQAHKSKVNYSTGSFVGKIKTLRVKNFVADFI